MKVTLSILSLCTVLLLGPGVTAKADDLVARLARDTPISAYGGALAWSQYDATTGLYELVVDRGSQAQAAPIAGSRDAFDVSLGPDGRGRVVALYTRCRTAGRGCDVYRYDVAAGREQEVQAVSSPTHDEAWPVQWGDRLAFVRRDRVYGLPPEQGRLPAAGGSSGQAWRGQAGRV